MKIYYLNKNIKSSKPYKGKITITEFNNVVYNLAYKEICFNNTILDFFNNSKKKFKYIWINKDDEYFELNNKKFFAPKCIVFSNVPKILNKSNYNYYFEKPIYILLSIDNDLEIRELNFQKPLKFDQTIDIDTELLDSSIISIIENTFFKIYSKYKKTISKPYEIPEETLEEETWINPNENSLSILSEFLNLCSENINIKNLIRKVSKGEIEELLLSHNKEDLSYNFYHTFWIFLNQTINTKKEIIVQLDSKFPLDEFKEVIIGLLKNNYSIEFDFLNNKYDTESELAITGTEIFRDFDNDLKKYNLKIGFIESDGDEYIMFLHKIDYTDRITSVLEKVNFKYFDVLDI